MGLPIIVYGKSGSGKSRSMKNFKEDEILLVNVEGKPLPFRGKMKYTMQTDNVDKMIDQMGKMPCKTAVIDDAGYLMTHYFMSNHRNKAGNSAFEMYDSIADLMYFLILKIRKELPEDVIVYILLHEDKDDFGEVRLLLLGKLLDRKVCLQGMVTICLRCMSEGGRHFFRTQTDGFDITKSPEGMFDEFEIENDLKLVDNTVREYWGMEVENNA